MTIKKYILFGILLGVLGVGYLYALEHCRIACAVLWAVGPLVALVGWDIIERARD